jgi:hypothetical protein
VAIRTEQHQILEPVIEPITIEVMQGHRDGSASPRSQPAAFAGSVLDAEP